MSYKKAMKHTPHKQLYYGFAILGPNERRKYPWLGRAWFLPGREKKRKAFVEEWIANTAKMLEDDPTLKIVG